MGWKYYNHAVVPESSPDEKVNISEIKNKSVWKNVGKKALFARWTEDFDCGYETDWWYVIKDSKYDIDTLKSKYRHHIVKGKRKFTVKPINPKEYYKQLFDVHIAAISIYGDAMGQPTDYDTFLKRTEIWNGYCFGAFENNEDGTVNTKLCGYAYLWNRGNCINLSVLKVDPKYRSKGVNAAIIDAILLHFEEEILKGKYICDGSRSINHQTDFQAYLEKYFGFRKAYCKLKIAYRPSLKLVIPVIYCFRNILKKFDNIRIIHLINSVLIMEEIKRGCED